MSDDEDSEYSPEYLRGRADAEMVAAEEMEQLKADFYSVQRELEKYKSSQKSEKGNVDALQAKVAEQADTIRRLETDKAKLEGYVRQLQSIAERALVEDSTRGGERELAAVTVTTTVTTATTQAVSVTDPPPAAADTRLRQLEADLRDFKRQNKSLRQAFDEETAVRRIVEESSSKLRDENDTLLGQLSSLSDATGTSELTTAELQALRAENDDLRQQLADCEASIIAMTRRIMSRSVCGSRGSVGDNEAVRSVTSPGPFVTPMITSLPSVTRFGPRDVSYDSVRSHSTESIAVEMQRLENEFDIQLKRLEVEKQEAIAARDDEITRLRAALAAARGSASCDTGRVDSDTERTVAAFLRVTEENDDLKQRIIHQSNTLQSVENELIEKSNSLQRFRDMEADAERRIRGLEKELEVMRQQYCAEVHAPPQTSVVVSDVMTHPDVVRHASSVNKLKAVFAQNVLHGTVEILTGPTCEPTTRTMMIDAYFDLLDAGFLDDGGALLSMITSHPNIPHFASRWRCKRTPPSTVEECVELLRSKKQQFRAMYEQSYLIDAFTRNPITANIVSECMAQHEALMDAGYDDDVAIAAVIRHPGDITSQHQYCSLQRSVRAPVPYAVLKDKVVLQVDVTRSSKCAVMHCRVSTTGAPQEAWVYHIMGARGDDGTGTLETALRSIGRNTFTVSGLIPNTTYCFRLASVTPDGKLVQGSEGSVSSAVRTLRDESAESTIATSCYNAGYIDGIAAATQAMSWEQQRLLMEVETLKLNLANAQKALETRVFETLISIRSNATPTTTQRPINITAPTQDGLYEPPAFPIPHTMSDFSKRHYMEGLEYETMFIENVVIPYFRTYLRSYDKLNECKTALTVLQSTVLKPEVMAELLRGSASHSTRTVPSLTSVVTTTSTGSSLDSMTSRVTSLCRKPINETITRSMRDDLKTFYAENFLLHYFRSQPSTAQNAEGAVDMYLELRKGFSNKDKFTECGVCDVILREAVVLYPANYDRAAEHCLRALCTSGSTPTK